MRAVNRRLNIFSTNGALEKSPLFRFIHSLRSSTGEKTRSLGRGMATRLSGWMLRRRRKRRKRPRPEDHLKKSSIQGNEVYLLGHHHLQKTEMVEVEECINMLCDRKGPLKLKGKFYKILELPYNKDDDVIKATYFEVISTLKDVLKISSVWRQYAKASSQDSKLLLALADNCYAGAFLFKDELGIDPSLVSGIETGKNINEFKGQELFNRLHDIGTMAQDSKLLLALEDNCYAGAFLFKDETGIDPSLVSGIETGKNINEFKGQELFNRLHDIGTMAQKSSIQGNEVYLLGHCHL